MNLRFTKTGMSRALVGFSLYWREEIAHRSYIGQCRGFWINFPWFRTFWDLSLFQFRFGHLIGLEAEIKLIVILSPFIHFFWSSLSAGASTKVGLGFNCLVLCVVFQVLRWGKLVCKVVVWAWSVRVEHLMSINEIGSAWLEDKISWTYLTGWIMVIWLIICRTWGEEWWKLTLLGLPYTDCHRVIGIDALAWGAISCEVPIFDGKSLVHLVVN